MRKAALVFLWIAFVAVGIQFARAQDDNASSKPAPSKSEQPKALHAYRVDFAINELEDGKKINSRHYSMNLNAGDGQQLKIGTRVPVVTSQFPTKDPDSLLGTQFQYLDVGTTILCRLDERDGDVGLDVHSDFSNFSSSQEQHPTQALARQPIIRQIKINGSTLATPGKTVAVGLVDDPNSNREFQLEATVTRLR